jgi:hypothetical protein
MIEMPWRRMPDDNCRGSSGTSLYGDNGIVALILSFRASVGSHYKTKLLCGTAGHGEFMHSTPRPRTSLRTQLSTSGLSTARIHEESDNIIPYNRSIQLIHAIVK